MSVTYKIDNTEILYKIFKAAAKKYNCSAEFNSETGTIKFIGPDELKKAISEEIIEFLK